MLEESIHSEDNKHWSTDHRGGCDRKFDCLSPGAAGTAGGCRGAIGDSSLSRSLLGQCWGSTTAGATSCRGNASNRGDRTLEDIGASTRSLSRFLPVREPC